MTVSSAIQISIVMCDCDKEKITMIRWT